MTSVAVLSDIHGNRWALEAVLRDIEARGVGAMVNLGDSLYGPLDPGGTADLMTARDMVSVRGNEDRIIIHEAAGDGVSPTLSFVRKNLDPRHFQWLEAQPETATAFDDVFLCHGTPKRDDEYLFHVVTVEGMRRRTPDELLETLEGITQTVVLCGHDHLQNSQTLADGRMILNPGSVGLGAYRDDVPAVHEVEAGSPHARYSVLWRETAGWRIQNIALSYDWQAAAAQAERNDRPDWACWLRTGRVAAS